MRYIQPRIFQSTWPHVCLLYVLKLSDIPFCIHSDLEQTKTLPLCIRGCLEARNWPRGEPLSLRWRVAVSPVRSWLNNLGRGRGRFFSCHIYFFPTNYASILRIVRGKGERQTLPKARTNQDALFKLLHWLWQSWSKNNEFSVYKLWKCVRWLDSEIFDALSSFLCVSAWIHNSPHAM